MASPKIVVMQDLLEEHFEELQFLWGQRQSALRSPRYGIRDLSDLEERIEAHLQGLLVGGEHGLAFLEKGLAEDDPVLVFLGAYGLLRSNTESAAQRVLDDFLKAEGKRLDGLRQALCHGPITPIRSQLQKVLASAPAPVGVATAEILACHGLLEITTDQFNRFLKNEEPSVRQAAWRTAARTSIPRKPEIYEAGLRDEDPAVRNEAMMAAAWGKHQGVLDFCRKLAAKPTHPGPPPPGGGNGGEDALYLLAVLGKPIELPRILALGKAAELGPRQFQILGAFGHPEVMELLLEGITNKDPRQAVAAAAAFTKVTGCPIDSDKRATLPPADGSVPDEFEKEFLDEAKVPSLELAKAHWQKVKSQMSKGTRWSRGFDLSQGANGQVLDQLDLESRLEACLRGRFDGTWSGNAFTLEAFPQKRA
jgi:uncharacterized protein (TIGR02270 family)